MDAVINDIRYNRHNGSVAERLNAPVLKTDSPSRGSRVRIPPLPPLLLWPVSPFEMFQVGDVSRLLCKILKVKAIWPRLFNFTRVHSMINRLSWMKKVVLMTLTVLPFLGFMAPLLAETADSKSSTMYFVRPGNLMVFTQRVKLLVDKKKVATLGQKKTLNYKTTKGAHRIQTKVGLSLGIPNITGFNGARKFKSKIKLSKDAHFFKIVFKPAIMGGKHEVIEISKAEYEKLVAAT